MKKLLTILLASMLIAAGLFTGSTLLAQENQSTKNFELQSNNRLTCISSTELSQGGFTKNERTKKFDLVVVQDLSDSFITGIDSVLTATKEAIDVLSPVTDRSMVVGYSNKHGSQAPITEAIGEISIQASTLTSDHSITKNKLFRALFGPTPGLVLGSSTPTAYALDKAKNLYESEKGATDNEVLYLLITDGFPNHKLDGTQLSAASGLPAYMSAIDDIKVASDSITSNPNAHFAVGLWINDADVLEKNWNTSFNDPTAFSQTRTKFESTMKAAVTVPEFFFSLQGGSSTIQDFSTAVNGIIQTNIEEPFFLNIDLESHFNVSTVDTVFLKNTTTNQFVTVPFPFNTPVINGNNLQWDLRALPVGTYEISFAAEVSQRLPDGKYPIFKSISTQTTTETITYPNTSEYTQVQSVGCENAIVKKVDSVDTTKLLDGAIFSLKNETLNTTSTITVNGSLSLTGLTPGNYTLTEQTAPLGYQLSATPITFTVDATTFDAGIVTIENTLLPVAPPEVTTDVVPEVTTSVIPEVTTDVIPEVTTDVIPEVTTDVIPEVTTDVIPEVTTDVIPEVTTDVIPEVTTDVIPEVTTDVIPEVTTDVVPEVTTAVVPEVTTDVVPEVTTAVVPEVTTAVVPEVTTAVVPEVTTAVVPEVTTAVVPEVTTAVVPEVTTDVVPEVTTPASSTVTPPTSTNDLPNTGESTTEMLSLGFILVLISSVLLLKFKTVR